MPKDGPSGITMATAMLSAITRTPCQGNAAMTGDHLKRPCASCYRRPEGKLPAAKTAGMKTVLVPKENEKDVEEISKEIK